MTKTDLWKGLTYVSPECKVATIKARRPMLNGSPVFGEINEAGQGIEEYTEEYSY